MTDLTRKAVATDFKPGTSRSRRRTRRRQAALPPAGDRVGILPLGTLLVLALLLGGAAEPLSQFAVEVAAIVVLIVTGLREDKASCARTWLGWLAIFVACLVAAFELAPLPYSMWRALPGHQPFAETLDALGLANKWRPLSLDPNATCEALLATLPGLAAFVATLQLNRRTHRNLALLVIAGALTTAVLGCFQIAGGQRFYLYADSNIGNLTGLFGNRNHAANQLLVGLALAATWLDVRPRNEMRFRIIAAGLMLLFGTAIFLTTSRTGASILAGECLVIPLALTSGSLVRRLKPLALCLLVVATVGLLYVYNPSVGRALDRFRDVEADLRPVIWNGTWRAAVDFFPTGSGLGTFVPIYARFEVLDTMPSQVINHAHNEYLELLLELGLIGGALILIYLCVILWASFRIWQRRDDRVATTATIAIGATLAFSATEFPLRNASAMVVFGLLNGIVLASARDRLSHRRG